MKQIHRSTKYICPNCGHEFTGCISLDSLGWHTSCPVCEGSFDVEVPEGRFVMAFADDESKDCYTYFTDDFCSDAIASYFAFDTLDELISEWKTICNQPVEDNGMWYWVLDMQDEENPVVIVSGACDPGDIEYLEEYETET